MSECEGVREGGREGGVREGGSVYACAGVRARACVSNAS